MDNILKEIKERRKSQRITLEQIADSIGVTKGNISRIERGESNVSLRKLVKILDEIGLEIVLKEKQ